MLGDPEGAVDCVVVELHTGRPELLGEAVVALVLDCSKLSGVLGREPLEVGPEGADCGLALRVPDGLRNLVPGLPHDPEPDDLVDPEGDVPALGGVSGTAPAARFRNIARECR